MVFSATLASSGGIIAYNGDSARGWNDPPTFAFSNNKTANKPKLDLRKRVSHQQALHGGQTPASAVHASVVNKDDVTNGEFEFIFLDKNLVTGVEKVVGRKYNRSFN